jgi:hypothetical protein
MNNSGELLSVTVWHVSKQTYTVIDHNLSPTAASKKVRQLRKRNLSAFWHPQVSKHRALEAERCSSCKKEIEDAFRRLGKSIKRKEK